MDDLDWSPARARAFGDAALDLWVGWLERLPDLPVDRGLRREHVLDAVAIDVPDEPMDDERLLEYLRTLVLENSMYPGHPGFMSYISGAGTVPGAVADLVVAAINQNVGGWRLGPGATEVELHLTGWLAQQFGLPDGSGGVMTVGGSVANFIGLKLARDAKGGDDVRRHGVVDRRLTIYASEEVHSTVEDAADLLGLGSDAVRLIATDDAFRLRVDLLDAAVERDRAAGLTPMAVVAIVGTTASGAIDPLEQIADLCARHDLWFHVDAAYGGAAVLVDELRSKLRGIERADSIAFDPHKWLYTPQSGGCALVRDFARLPDSFSAHGTYIYQDLERTGRGPDLVDFGPQFSRGFQGLKVWTSLLAHGRDAYARRIAHDVALASYLGELVEEHPELELVTAPALSICCFRYVPLDLDDGPARGDYLNHLNERVMTDVQLDGRVHFSNAVLRDVFALRVCIVNFRTEARDIVGEPRVAARTVGEVADGEPDAAAVAAVGDGVRRDVGRPGVAVLDRPTREGVELALQANAVDQVELVVRGARVHAERVLGHVHPDAADHPGGAGLAAQPTDHRRDRVQHVVAAGPAEVRQTARDGDRAVVIGGDAQRVAREHDRAREAAVEVEVRQVVEPDARGVERGQAHARHHRRGTQVLALGEVPHFGAVRPPARVDAALARDAELVRLRLGGEDQRPGHVDVHERDHVLRVRVADHPVVGGPRDDLLRAALDREPRVRVRRGDLRHRGEQLAEARAVLVGRDAELRAPGDVEEREREVRVQDAVRELARVDRCLELVADLLGGAVAPLRPLAALLEALHRVERLAPGDEHQVERAIEDRPARPAHEDLRRRPSHRRVVPVPAVARPDPLGEACRRVVVRPRQRVDDLDAVELRQQLRRIRVLGRDARDRVPHVERLGRVGLTAPGPLRDADDAGRAGIDTEHD
ncbi:MAG: hypothetical protein LC789_18745 [Actinobacteria bacterium]|nr:hypothetical protein [Actinomycetota bacterium]